MRRILVKCPARDYFAGVLQAIHTADPTARTVSLFHATTGFGRDVARGAKMTAASLQMQLQAVPFDASQALENVATVPEAGVLLVVGNFAAERAVAPLLLRRTWRWKAFVGAGVEEVLAPLGELREGLRLPLVFSMLAVSGKRAIHAMK